MEGPASITLETTPRALPLLPALPPPRPGAFLFDLLLPPDYPRSPPRVQFLTTGGGRVRFNPNLYEVRLEGGRERGGVLSFYAFFASRLWRQAGAVQPKPVRGEAGGEGGVVFIPLFLCSAFYGSRRVRFNPNLYEVRLAGMMWPSFISFFPCSTLEGRALAGGEKPQSCPVHKRGACMLGKGRAGLVFCLGPQTEAWFQPSPGLKKSPFSPLAPTRLAAPPH